MLADLITSEGVVEEMTLRGPTGVMALHGGLEAGTAEAARRTAAAAGSSLYVVEQPQDLRWHVPSIRFDPKQSRKLTDFLTNVRLAVSYHGFGRRGLESTVLIGGRNQRLREALGASISRRTGLRTISDPLEIPEGLHGAHPANPVNLPEFGGAQIELAPQLREGTVLEGIVDSVARVLAAEHRSLCANPSVPPSQQV